MNHVLMSAIDRSLHGKTFEERIPSAVEETARNEFERGSEAMFGKAWVWADSSEEVRNRFRIAALIRQYVDPNFYI